MVRRGEADSPLKKKECLTRALRLLSYRDRSEKEMRERLRSLGFDVSEIEGTMAYLKEKAFINDDSYCKRWAEYRMENAPSGPRKLESDLKKKGFDEEIVTSVCESIWSRYNEFDTALSLARKKYIQGKTELLPEVARRIFGFLLRNGFSGEVAGRVLTELRK
ncbi:MAG: regulatory protein RecX [Nitrospinota bacterium]